MKDAGGKVGWEGSIKGKTRASCILLTSSQLSQAAVPYNTEETCFEKKTEAWVRIRAAHQGCQRALQSAWSAKRGLGCRINFIFTVYLECRLPTLAIWFGRARGIPCHCLLVRNIWWCQAEMVSCPKLCAAPSWKQHLPDSLDWGSGESLSCSKGNKVNKWKDNPPQTAVFSLQLGRASDKMNIWSWGNTSYHRWCSCKTITKPIKNLHFCFDLLGV